MWRASFRRKLDTARKTPPDSASHLGVSVVRDRVALPGEIDGVN